MSERRGVRLSRIGGSQTVRIPTDIELPGDEATMHREGDRLVIEPVRKRGLIALLKSMTPLDEEFPHIDDSMPQPVGVLKARNPRTCLMLRTSTLASRNR